MTRMSEVLMMRLFAELSGGNLSHTVMYRDAAERKTLLDELSHCELGPNYWAPNDLVVFASRLRVALAKDLTYDLTYEKKPNREPGHHRCSDIEEDILREARW